MSCAFIDFRFHFNRRLSCSEFETPQLGVPSRGVSTQTTTSFGVWVLRAYRAAWAGKKSARWTTTMMMMMIVACIFQHILNLNFCRLSRSHDCTNHISDAARRSILSQARLSASRHQTREHSVDCSRYIIIETLSIPLCNQHNSLIRDANTKKVKSKNENSFLSPSRANLACHHHHHHFRTSKALRLWICSNAK